MKKFICGLLIGLLLSLPLATFASGQALRLVVNGQDITAEAQPVIIDGRTLVPARALAEKLGATVGWDGASQTVVVTSVKDQAVVEAPVQRPVENWLTIEEATNKYGDRLSALGLVIKGGEPTYYKNKSVYLSDGNNVYAVFVSKTENNISKVLESDLLYLLKDIETVRSQ